MPLYHLFEVVQSQLNRQLGLADYMLLLDALQQGIGVGNRLELEQLCAMLWLKSKPQQDFFKVLFADFWSKEEESLRLTIQPDPLPTPKDSTETLAENVSDKAGAKEYEDNPDLKKSSKDILESKEDTSPLNATTSNFTTSEAGHDRVKVYFNMEKIAAGSGASITQNGETSPRQLSGRYNLRNDYLPFLERELIQQWRRLRRRRLPQQSKAVDITATIATIAKQGFFERPIFKRQLANDFKLTVIVDFKGSMLAFHSLTNRIVTTLQQVLPGTAVWYIRNTPEPYLYAKPDWMGAISTDDWLQKFRRAPTSILIISDGGAARGNFVAERLHNWWKFFNETRPVAPRVLWLNPMPEARWEDSTAYFMSKMVKMIELKDDISNIKALVKLFKNEN